MSDLTPMTPEQLSSAVADGQTSFESKDFSGQQFPTTLTLTGVSFSKCTNGAAT